MKAYKHLHPKSPSQSRGLKLVLAAAVLAAAIGTSAANDIRGVRVLEEKHNELKLSVSYQYSGNFGDNVFVGAEMATDGKSSRFYAHRPARLRRGNGTATITLLTNASAPSVFTSNQVKIKMYVGGSYSIVEEIFPQRKTWRKSPVIAPPRPLPTAPREDCLAFNPRNVRVVAESGGKYLLTDGRSRMKVFPNRAEAAKALRIIRHYRLDAHCFVGRPKPSLEYWLVDGRAPSGSMPGEDALRFNPRNLEVKRIRGDWKIVDGSHWLLSFPNRSEASQALAVIRKHGFTHLCFVGRPNASMTYLRK